MRKVAIAVGAVLALTAVAAMPRVAGNSAPAAETPPPPPTGPGVPVTAGAVAAADVPGFLNALGTVQAYNMVTIRSRVDGQIVKVAFNEGQDVKAGSPIIEIDPPPFQAALDQAQAAKAKDEAQLTG